MTEGGVLQRVENCGWVDVIVNVTKCTKEGPASVL